MYAKDIRKISLLFLCTFVLSIAGWAQSMSDQDVLKEAIKEKSSGASEAEIAAHLIQKGAVLVLEGNVENGMVTL